jgi:hypothetical protein
VSCFTMQLRRMFYRSALARAAREGMAEPGVARERGRM